MFTIEKKLSRNRAVSSRSIQSAHLLAVLALAVLAAFMVPARALAAPMFVLKSEMPDPQLYSAGLNNAGDFCGIYNPTPSTTAPFLNRGGTLADLTPTDPNILSAYPLGIGPRLSDGSVMVVGFSDDADGYRRPIVWTIESNLSFSTLVLSNYVLPPDSQSPGEQGSGEALAVNASGEVVGDGQSYLADVAMNWQLPDTTAQAQFFSTGSQAVAVNASGLMLVNGIEYDHGGPLDRVSAGVTYGAPDSTEIPYAYYDGNPVNAAAMDGDYVCGSASFSSNYVGAFVWTIGAPGIVQLPAPAGYPMDSSAANSVNSAGDVVGWIHTPGSYGGYFNAFWKLKNGSYTGYILNTLFPLEPYQAGIPTHENTGEFINDKGEILILNDYGSYSDYSIRVYEPVTNAIVQFDQPYFSGDKHTNSVSATVDILRADGYTGTVSVHYATTDDTAIAGQDYTGASGVLTWTGADSSARTISVRLQSNDLYSAYGSDFYLELSNVSGAILGTTTNAEVAIEASYESIGLTNLSSVDNQSFDVTASQTNVVITVTRLGWPDGTLTISSVTGDDGTAVAGTDYIQDTNDLGLAWAPGETGPKSFDIELIPHPGNTETNTFYLSISGDVDGTNAVYGFATVNIVPVGTVPPVGFGTNNLWGAGRTNLALSVAVGQGLTVTIQESTNALNWVDYTNILCTNGLVTFDPPIIKSRPLNLFKPIVKGN